MRWEVESGGDEDEDEAESDAAHRAHDAFVDAASRLRPGPPARPLDGSDGESSE